MRAQAAGEGGGLASLEGLATRHEREAFIWSSVHESWHEEPIHRPTLEVGIVIWPEFTLTALSGFVDALRLAADVDDRSKPIRCKWTVMSHDGNSVRASCGLAVSADCGLQSPTRFDYLVIVSGLVSGIRNAPSSLLDYVRHAGQTAVPLVGLCTGALVLAAAGLMRGRQCCIQSFHVADLQELGCGAIPLCDRLFYEDGRFITCAGGTASIDLASYLVQRHCGDARAVKLIDRLMVDRPRAGGHAQSRTGLDWSKIHDPRVRKAIVLMEQHVEKPLPIQVLARMLNSNERNLQRGFIKAFGKSPAILYRQLRLRYSKWFLENTDDSVTEIALRSGFSDASHFSRLFRSEFHCTPSEFREQIRSAAPGSTC